MLDRYINLLKSGCVVAFPTETVYGLGADAFNREAVQKIFKIKGRPADNPLIVHVSSPKMLDQFALTVPDETKQLTDAFWPGPLTLIFNKKPAVLDIVTAGLSTVAIRWPNHPLAQDLIAQVGPLVAPSANSSGKPSPTKPKHVKEDFGDAFPIIEAGETQIGLESTVLDISEKPFKLYRPGGISKNQIENVIKERVVTVKPDKQVQPKSPGMKYSHYSPDAKVEWLSVDNELDDLKTLYLLHSQSFGKQKENIIHFEGNYSQMAHQLFDLFRTADHQGMDTVAIEPFTEDILAHQPIAAALVNRIEKAIGI